MILQHDLLIPEEDGTLGGTASPENLLRLAAAAVQASARILVGTESDSGFARAAADIFCGGVAAMGGTAIFAPNITLPALSVASDVWDTPLLLHIADNRLRLLEAGLLPLSANVQHKLYQQSSPQWLAPVQFGDIITADGIQALFAARIRERLPSTIPVLPEIGTGSAALEAEMTRVLRGGHGEMLTLQFSSDGRRLAVFSRDCGWIFHERLLLLICAEYFAHGKDVALPYWMPHAAEQLAAQYHRNVLRYASCSDGSDAAARDLAKQQGFTLSAALLCADLLRMLAEKDTSLTERLAALPRCHTVRRIVSVAGDENNADTVKKWQNAHQAQQTDEGYLTDEPRGRALVRPSRSGKTVTLLAEAESMEAASELAGSICAELERLRTEA